WYRSNVDARTGSGTRWNLSCPARTWRRNPCPGSASTAEGESSSMTERIRILIADDSPMFRKGLNALLKSFADAELVGEATTGKPGRSQRRGHLQSRDCAKADALFWQFQAARPGVDFPRINQPRARNTGADCRGLQEPGDRRASDAQPEDGAEPRLEHLQQVA